MAAGQLDNVLRLLRRARPADGDTDRCLLEPLYRE